MKRKQTAFLVAIVILLIVFGWEWRQQHKTIDFVTDIDTGLESGLEQFLQSQVDVWQEAITAHESVGEVPPLDLYLLVAYNAQHLGDLQLSKETYETYFLHHKANYAAYNNYGHVLRQMGDLANAEVAYRRVIEFAGDVESYYHDLARVLSEQDRDEELEELYKDAIDQVGQTRSLLVALAQWYETFGDCEGALSHYEVAKQVAENENMAQAVQEEIDRLKASCQ